MKETKKTFGIKFVEKDNSAYIKPVNIAVVKMAIKEFPDYQNMEYALNYLLVLGYLIVCVQASNTEVSITVTR